MQSEYVQKLQRVPAQRRVPLADPVQEVEVFGLRKLLRFRNARRKVFPGHDSFDSGEGSLPLSLASSNARPTHP